ncbi:WbqC family protein [bacterium]|nr:WbqC family protein [bacterium]
MIVSVHQPHYLPWLGYIDKIDAAGTFVLLDTVQYEIRGWQNRNLIKTPSGKQWLTIPVNHEFETPVRDVAIDNSWRWAKKHANAIRMNYSRAPWYSRYGEYFEALYSRPWEILADLNTEMLRFFVGDLGLAARIVKASELGVDSEEPNERIARIVAEVGGDVYLSGHGAREYFCEEPFRKAGIRVVFQEFETVPYPQLYGDFIPGLSVIDALFNMGPQAALEIIRKGRRTAL